MKNNSDLITEKVKRQDNSDFSEENNILKSSKNNECRYLSPQKERKITSLKPKSADSRPNYLTLLFEESLKKKRKKKNTLSLGSTAFDCNYLKEFS